MRKCAQCGKTELYFLGSVAPTDGPIELQYLSEEVKCPTINYRCNQNRKVCGSNSDIACKMAPENLLNRNNMVLRLNADKIHLAKLL